MFRPASELLVPPAQGVSTVSGAMKPEHRIECHEKVTNSITVADIRLIIDLFQTRTYTCIISSKV